jgi:hypothetical protein
VGTVPICFKALNQDIFLIFLQLQIVTNFLVVPLLLLICKFIGMDEGGRGRLGTKEL